MVVTGTRYIATVSNSVGNMSELKQDKLHGRVCEESFVKRIVRRDFLLLEESEPVWMLSLKSIYVRKLYVLKKTSSSFVTTFKTKFSDKINLIGDINIIFVSLSCLSDVSPSCTILASGSLSFLVYSSSLTQLRGT